jgi:hypothetical protein
MTGRSCALRHIRRATTQPLVNEPLKDDEGFTGNFQPVFRKS